MKIRIFVIVLLMVLGCAQGYARANELAQLKKELPGTYLAATSADMIHEYGKYVIDGDVISFYSWDQNRGCWSLRYSTPFIVVYVDGDDYMSGYNLVYTNEYGYEAHLCVGDVDEDGRLDLWMSDFMYHTKQ